MKKMAPWAKRFWLNALDDPKYHYRPGLGQLRVTENGVVYNDALGILCEAAPRVHYQPSRHMREEARYFYKNKIGIEIAPILSSYVPDNLAEEMGLSYIAQFHITNLSDDGAELKDIKEWIRRNI